MDAATKELGSEHVVSEESYALFILDGQEFGVRIDYVRETILNTSCLTRMPTSIDIVDGLINLRGSIIPIINLRTRFRIESSLHSSESPIAIVQFHDALFGLLFDEINEVTFINTNDVNSIDVVENDVDICCEGVVSLDDGNSLVQLLDLDLIFEKYNLPKFNNIIDRAQRVFRPLKQDVVILLNEQEYAISVSAIQEIIRPPEIHRRVKVDSAILGVSDLRGELFNIVDLRHHFSLSDGDPQAQDARIIILQGEMNCGVLVDAVKEVVQYEEDQLLPIPQLDPSQEKFSGIVALGDGRNLIKINPEALFNAHLLRQLQGNLELHDDSRSVAADLHLVETQENTDIASVLITFRLGDDYAFDIQLFQEIINYQKGIVFLPGSAPYHQGVLNLRHHAIPIINLRKYYEMDDFSDLSECKIIILNLPQKTVGIMVDDIIEIVKPDRCDVERIPSLTVHMEGKKGSHIREGYRIKTTLGEEKSLLVFDVEAFIEEIEVL